MLAHSEDQGYVPIAEDTSDQVGDSDSGFTTVKMANNGRGGANFSNGEVFIVRQGILIPASTTIPGSAETENNTTPIGKTLPRKPRSTPCNIGCRAWCRKYFWEGQMLSGSHAKSVRELDNNASLGKKLLGRYRGPLSLALPAVVCHFFWWCVMVKYNLWYLFPKHYYMSITMVFGSLIAGMTSEGGGAVAFPVMTLALNIKPSVARDFSMLIQAFGMMCAAFAIFFMKVQIEWRSVIFCTLGGAVGIITGLEFIDPLLSSSEKKMGFVSLWFSFAFALFLLNRYHKRKTYPTIPDFNYWKAAVLIAAGFWGGIFTSFAGSGLDVCSFSILTLLFRVTEKTATPTSVVLMGFNSSIGSFWRVVMMNGVSRDVFEYLVVCVAVVVVGAPLGSVIGSHFHRQVLAALVYTLDIISLVGAFILVPQTPALAGGSAGVIVGGFVFFFGLTKLGNKIMERADRQRQANRQESSEVDQQSRPLTSCGPHTNNADQQVSMNLVSATEEQDIRVVRL